LLEPGPVRRFGRWLPFALLVYMGCTTMSATLTRGRFQFFAFQISFGALELFCLFRVYLLSRKHDNRPFRLLFRLGVAFYIAAIALWFIDIRFCSAMSIRLPAIGLPNPQLHAWWHVLVSCGFYMLLLVVGYDRLQRDRAGPAIKTRGRIIPSVAING
jgi:dihydroceramidase